MRGMKVDGKQKKDRRTRKFEKKEEKSTVIW